MKRLTLDTKPNLKLNDGATLLEALHGAFIGIGCRGACQLLLGSGFVC